jgi:hypothetical protein
MDSRIQLEDRIRGMEWLPPITTGGKPLKADKGLSYGPIGRSWSVKDIPGVHNHVRVHFEDSIDDLRERIINVLFPLIDAAGSNFCVSGITQMGVR